MIDEQKKEEQELPPEEDEDGKKDDDEERVGDENTDIPEQGVGGKEENESSEGKVENGKKEPPKKEWAGGHTLKGTHPTVPPPDSLSH